jgi:hypothetical protein
MNYLPVLDMMHNLALLMDTAYVFDRVFARGDWEKTTRTLRLFKIILLFSEVKFYRRNPNRRAFQ